MDEEALKDAHKLFLETGYKGDLAKFKNLISTNPNALKDAHKLFVNTGYNKSIDDFSTLVGVKKKVGTTSTSTTPNQKLVSGKKVGSSGTQKPDNSKKLDELFAKTSQNPKSNKSEEIAYQKILKNKPLVNKPIKEVNREEIAVPTKVEKQILAETPKQEITPLPQGFQELVDNKIFQKAKDFETKEIAKGIDRYTSDEYDNLEKEQELRHLSNLTNVDETKKQIFKDEVEEEANVEGILNNVNQGAKELWNNVVLNSPMALSTANQLNINPFVSTKPLYEQREQFIRLQEAKGRKRNDLTEKEILEGAKEIRFNEKVDNERLTLRNEVLGARENPAFGYFSPLKFSEKQRDELAKYKIDETNTLTEKSLADLSIMQMIKGDLLNMKDKSNSVLNKITNKEQLSEEEINFVKTFKQNTEDLQKKYDIYSDKYSNSKEKIGSVLEEAVALASDRGLEADLKQLMLTGGKMLVGGLTILNELNPMSHLEGNDVLENTFTESQNILTEGQKTDLPTLPDEVTSLGSAFDYTKSMILDFVPQMAIGWMTGGAGNVSKLSMLKPMVTTGLLGAGQQINEINQSNKEGLTNLTEQQKYISSAFAGFSDSLQFGAYSQLAKGSRVISAVLKTPTLRPLIRKSINQKIIEEGKDFAKTFPIEQMEEGIANISTNVDRKYNLKENNVNLSDNSGDTFKSTTILTLFMKLFPFVASRATKPFFNKDNTKQIDSNSREILRLTEELKNINLSEDAKSVIQKSIDNRGKENDNILKGVIDKIVDLGDVARNKVFELEKTTSDLRAKAESINNDNTISKETKQTALNDLKSEYVKSEELRNKIIEGKSTILDVVSADKKEEMKSNALNVLLSEKEGSNEAQFTNDVIEQKAIELYNNQIKSKDIKNEIVDLESKLPKEKIDKIKSFADAGNQSKKDQSPKALGNFIIDNSQVGDKIRINEDSYYEVVSKRTNKKGHTETELQHFIKNEETGKFEINPSAVKLFTDKYRGTDLEKLGYKDASNLFESSYTNSNGEKVIEQSIYEPNEAQAQGDLGSLEKVEYEDFVNNNNVSDERLFDIAEKVKKGDRLTPYENSVFTGKTTEINKIIANESISEGDIAPNEGVRVGDNADLQQREQQPEVIEVQSTADVGESKPNAEIDETKQALVKSIKDGNYIVDFDENKNVTKIVSQKTGKEIRQFSEVEFTDKNGNKSIKLKKNANYSAIEADALGEKTDSKVKTERTKKLNTALQNFEPYDAYTAVQYFLASGGKMSFKNKNNDTNRSVEYHVGKNKKDFNWKFDENAPTLEEVANTISEENGIDIQQIQDKLINEINSGNQKSSEDYIIHIQDSKDAETNQNYKESLNNLSEEQRAYIQSIEDNEQFFEDLSPIDQAIFFGEKIKEANQFNINQNGKTKEERSNDSKSNDKAIQGTNTNGTIVSDSAEQKPDNEKSKPKESEPTRKERVAERKKAVNSSIDELANALKDLLPKAPNTEGLKQNGLSQDDLINFIAESAKVLAGTTIEISESINQVIEHLKSKGYDVDVDADEVLAKFQKEEKKQEKKEEPKSKSKQRKPIDKNEIKEGSFEDLVMNLPTTGTKKESKGVETAIKLTEDITIGKETYDSTRLFDTFEHANNYINVAIEQFGDNFVDEVVKYIEENQLDPHEIAFAFVALENKLRQFLDSNPKDLTTKKQLDYVRKKRIAYVTKLAKGLNAPKIQNLAYYGYDTSEVTDMMFTEKEKTDRKKLSEAIETDIDAIQKQEESFDEFEEDIEEIDSLLRGKRKEDVKSKKEELAKDIDKIKSDIKKKLDALKNKGLRGSFDAGLTERLVAISPEIIKLAKLYAKSTKLSTKEIIDNIHDDFKDVVDGLKKKDIVDVLKKDLQKESSKKPKKEKSEEEILQDKLDKRTQSLENRLAELKENKAKDVSGKSSVWNEEISNLQSQIKTLKDLQKESSKKPNYLAIVKKALIDAGLGKTITVTTKNGKEERTFFDWKKLVGDELSLENIKKHVEETLLGQGYTQEQLDAISFDLQNQYNNLHADIIKKKSNEINRRNKINYNTSRNNAYRLAELYNLGLFEDQRKQFDNIFNSLLGTSKLDQETFDTLTEMANGLAKIQKENIGFFGKKLEKDIIDKINKIVHKYKVKKAPLHFKVMEIIDKFFGMATRMILHSMGQVVSNTYSGLMAVSRIGLYNKIKGDFTNKKMRKRANKIANATAIDIVLNSGSDYGDVDANLSRNSSVEDFLNGKTNNKIAHILVSAYFGKIHLNGADSYYKSIITNGKLYQALIDIATDKSNPNRMTKEEAKNYITEKLTGTNWNNSIEKAKEIVEKVNTENELVSDKKENITRIAEGLVLANLLDNKVFSSEMIESAYKASYTSAGFDLGHESNNIVTTMVNKANIALSKEYEEALKNEDYGMATLLLLSKSVFGNFIKTFVGGGTNWAVLTAQSTGLDLYSIIADNVKANAKSNKIDLSEDGIKNLERALKRKLNARSTNTRMAIGAVVSTAMLLAYLGTDEDDEKAIAKKTKKWLDENKWAKPYFSYIAPASLVILVNATENDDKEITKEMLKMLGIKDPNFEDNVKIAKAIKLAYSGKKDEALVEMNKFIGSKANAPIPWRTVRDIEKIYRGLNGMEEIKPNYKTKDPIDALFDGGFAEWIGMINTKDSESENNSKDKSNNSNF